LNTMTQAIKPINTIVVTATFFITKNPLKKIFY